MKPEAYRDAIEACHRCADACDHCAAACLLEDDVKAMARCVALDIDCADLSFRTFQVLHEPTPKTPDAHSFDNNFDGIACQFDDY